MIENSLLFDLKRAKTTEINVRNALGILYTYAEFGVSENQPNGVVTKTTIEPGEYFIVADNRGSYSIIVQEINEAECSIIFKRYTFKKDLIPFYRDDIRVHMYKSQHKKGNSKED